MALQEGPESGDVKPTKTMKRRIKNKKGPKEVTVITTYQKKQ